MPRTESQPSADGRALPWTASGLAARWRRLDGKTQRLLTGLLAAALMPFVAAVTSDWLERSLHVRAPNMIFLCSVMFAALWFGRRVSIFAAVFAFVIYNFYLTEPRGVFGFAGWEDVLTLLLFIGVALLLGGLAGNLHDQRNRAQEQVRLFANLFAVSRPLAECDDTARALRLLEDGARQMAAKEAIVFAQGLDPRTRAPGVDEDLARAVADMLGGGSSGERVFQGWRLQLVYAGDQRAAVLAWRPQYSAAEEELAISVRLLSELAGVAIERAQYIEQQLEMEALAATEKLRTALMSSISHDFRTPLSTILTSSSSLLTYGEQFSPATRTDLLTSIQEEAERLNRFVGNIMDMTRLDAGVIRPRNEWGDPLEILDKLQERMRRRLGKRRVEIMAPAAVPAIFVDPLLLEQALVNVVENALAHAANSDVLRFGADYTDNEVHIWVEDDGPGVPGEQLASIFDKFHRLSANQSSQGAGLGLAISKGFVEAMSGKARAVNASADGGLKVVFSFPRVAEAVS